MLPIVVAIDNVDHTKIAGELAAKRGIDRRKGGPLRVVETSMPKMCPIQIERFFLEWQQIPSITGQINVHPLLRNHLFGAIEDDMAILLVANALDPRQVIAQIRLQQVMEGINPLIQQSDIEIRKAKNLFRQRTDMRPDNGDDGFGILLLNSLRQATGADHTGCA